MSVAIRPATADDQEAIVALVHSERLNPNGLHWPNFVVAVDDRGALVGAAQMRKHKDGSRELGSLVVAPVHRRQGVAARMIEALLKGETKRVHVITGKVRAAYFSTWGFRPIDTCHAPGRIQLNYYMGSIAGGLFALLKRRPRNRLVILDRLSAWQPIER